MVRAQPGSRAERRKFCEVRKYRRRNRRNRGTHEVRSHKRRVRTRRRR